MKYEKLWSKNLANMVAQSMNAGLKNDRKNIQCIILINKVSRIPPQKHKRLPPLKHEWLILLPWHMRNDIWLKIMKYKIWIPYRYNLPTIFKIGTIVCVTMETVFNIIKSYCLKLYKEMYMSIYIDICIYI